VESTSCHRTNPRWRDMTVFALTLRVPVLPRSARHESLELGSATMSFLRTGLTRWRVRPHRRHLIVGADCEDDAKSLAQELCGDGRVDADAAFRVRRVDIYASWTDGGAFSGGGP